MPIYEYVCRSCHRSFEELVHGDAAVECPTCSGRDVEKVLSAFAALGRAEAPRAACGACGDPRGPFACRSS